MATSLQTVRRLTIESRTVGVDESSQKLARLGQAQDSVAASSERAARQAGAYERALANQQRSIDLANQAYLEMARDRAALAAAMQQQVAANDNVARSFTVAGLEAAEMANHLRTVGTAAYAFSPAFREVVNSMAAPALKLAGGALVAVAGGLVTATNVAGTGLVRLGSSAALASASLTPVAGAITSAGLAMQAFNPSLAGVASTIVGRLLPALRLLGVVGLIANAVGLLTDAWRLGGEELERYRQIAERAAKVDLSTTYFQRLMKGAEDAKVPVESLTSALLNLEKSSADKLGGSALQNRLDASVKAGNFSGNTGVQDLAQANTTQQRFEAIVSLVNQAMTAGQRLAALDIAGTAFGPEVADNLRKDSEYLDKILQAASKVSEKTLVSPEDIGRALDLQRRYDAATAILETRWHPIQTLLTQMGIEFRANWVATVETIAQGVDWASKLVAKLADAPAWFQKKMGEGAQWFAELTTTPESREATAKEWGVVTDKTELSKDTDAYAKAIVELRAKLQDYNEQQRKVSEVNTIAQKTFGDTSKVIDGQKKATQEAADAYDRALEGVTKHTARMQADAQAVGLGAGALEEFRARTQLMTAAQLSGREITAQLTAEIDAQAKAAGIAGAELAKLRVQNDIKFDRATIGLSAEEAQIAQQLRRVYPDVTTALESAEAAQMRLNNQMREAKDISSGFANDLVGGLLRGEDAMKAMGTAATNLVQKLASANVSRFMNGGSVFGNQSLTSAQGAVGMVGAGVAGYQSGDPLTGALGGAMAGATFGPAGAVAGGIIGLVGGIFGANEQSKKKLEAAQKAWREAGPAFEVFLSQMTGGVQGSIATKFQQLNAQVRSFADKAAEAEDYAAIDRLYGAFNSGVYRASNAFKESFGGMLDAINDGLGPNSPFASASDNVKQVSDTLKGFIDDVRIAYSNDRVAAATGGAPLVAGGGESQIAAATAAAQKYLLTLLGQTPVLSSTATAIQQMNGTAVQLRSALTELGMSSGEAADAINKGVIAAMDALKKNFAEGLTSRLNVATGKGYLNDAAALLKQYQQDSADAASLGLDQAQVAAVFRAEAQKIVDDAGLIGDSFGSFIDLFPQFNGLVGQSATALAAATQKVQAFVKSLNDYLNNLTVGPNSTLSPAAQLSAAQSNFAAQLALAKAGDADALGTITQYATTLLDQAKGFYASSSGYTAIYDQVTTALKELPGAIGAGDGTSKIVTAINSAADENQALLSTQNLLMSTANSLATSQISLADSQVGILSSIQSLQSIASAQLNLLNQQYAASPITAPNGAGGVLTSNNLMIQALNKIVYNTYAIAQNTAGGSVKFGGLYADGGWITGGVAGRDSVPLANGGLGMPGEFVIRHDIAQANKSWLADFNATGRLPLPPVARQNGSNDNRTSAPQFDWQALARALKQVSDQSDERISTKLDELIEAINETPGKNSAATRRLVEGMKQRAS